MFLREPSWKYSAKLVGSQLGQLFFANLVGSIRRSYIRVQKASLNMFWEHSSSSMIIASDWLRAELSCGRRKIKIKMDDGVARFFTRFGGNFFICWLVGGAALSVSGTQNEIVVSWSTLWGMMKLYWLDLTLAYIFDYAVCCASAASSGRSLNLITKPVENEVKFVELSEPCSAN